MITLEEYALTMEQLQKLEKDNEVDILGGFIPDDPDLFEQVNEAAANQKQSGPTSIPKTPILFDKWDTLFLNQFPPEFCRQALVWRYREGLIMAAESVESGRPIPESANIKFSTRGRRSKDKDLSAQKGEGEAIFTVKTFLRTLYEKLTKKRNLQLLSESDPKDKPSYEKEYGNYGFDLSDRWQDKSGHWHSKNFNFMTEEAAKRILASWRRGIVSGMLNAQQPEIQKMVQNARGGYQFWGGGHNPNEAILDWQGNLIDASHRGENTGVYTMLHSSETTGSIAKELGLDVSPDGRVRYKYRKGDRFVEEEHHLPVLLPGFLLPSYLMQRYKARIGELASYKARMQNEPQNPKWKKLYEETVEQHKKVIETARRRNEFDWNVSRYNLSTREVEVKQPDGSIKTIHVRKYRTMYAKNENLGGTTPTKMHQERIEGSKEAKNTLKKWFLDDGPKEERSMDDERRIPCPPGIRIEGDVQPEGLEIKNPVQAGADMFMKLISNSSTHGEVYPILEQMYGDVLDFTNKRLMELSGEPALQKFSNELKNAKATSGNIHKWPEELKASWQSLYNFLLSRSYSYASQLAQIDLGAGTRRDRESRFARMAMLQHLEPNITDQQQKSSIEKWKQQWQLTPDEQAQVQKIFGIPGGSGIRLQPRQLTNRGWPGHEVGGPRPDPKGLVQFAHSFEQLNRNRAEQVSQARKTRHEQATDVESMRESIRQELSLRYSMYDDYFFYDILHQMMQGMSEDKIDAQHAKNYAVERTKADLKASGIRVSNIESVQMKGLSRSDEAHKNRILKELKGEMRPKATLSPSAGNEKVMGLGDDADFIEWLAKSPQWMKSAEDKIKALNVGNDPMHPLVRAVTKAKKMMPQQPQQQPTTPVAPAPKDWLFPGMENLALTRKKKNENPKS